MDFVVEHDQHQTHRSQSDPYQRLSSSTPRLSPQLESSDNLNGVLAFFRPRVLAIIQSITIPLPVQAV